MSALTFQSYIDSHYTVAFKGDGVDPANMAAVKEFLLCNTPFNHAHTMINADLINGFSEVWDGVLVENARSMSPTSACKTASAVWLSTMAPINGWDIGTYAERLGGSTYEKFDRVSTEVMLSMRKVLEAESGDPFDAIGAVTENFFEVLSFGKGRLGAVATRAAREEGACTARCLSMQESLKASTKSFVRTFTLADSHLLLEREDLHTFLASRKTVVLVPKVETAPAKAAALTSLLMSTSRDMLASFTEDDFERLAAFTSGAYAPGTSV